MTKMTIPIGLNLASIGVSASWWIEAAERAEGAGFGAAWIWDHFVSRGELSDPVLECWTTLAATSMRTQRIRLGSFVTNVMNRHPAVLARMVATTAELSGGRIELGIGAGGHPAEHRAYGMAFPPRPQRAEYLDEAISVLRLLFAGGPVDFEGRHLRLEGAHAFPVPDPTPRIVIAGTTAPGARMAAQRGDVWTCFGQDLAGLLPIFDDALVVAGRSRADVPIIVSIETDEVGDDLQALTERWQERGASELIVHDVRPEQLSQLIELAQP